MADLEHLQREAAQNRLELTQSLSTLSERLTPQNLAAEATQHVAASGSDFVKSLAQNINGSGTQPIVTTLISTGWDWLRTPKKPVARFRHDAPPEPITPAAAQAAAQTQTQETEQMTTHPGTFEKAQIELSKLRHQARDMRARIAEGTEELSEEARARVIAAREKAIATAEAAATKGRDATRRGTDFVQENPLVVGGIALAVGAAVAGAIMWKRNNDHDRESAFAEADAVLEDELSKVSGRDRTAVIADLNESSR
ncbi:DUF3618 domain-containing protein [Aliishimia ponticola]|uniref:DUF3618 domain-containing protein n=1 Tax=Aliishimia ponticola TaxID=2499833 RepID=A0A4S4NF13_9RHOB|nr:DUF3618 domain-containing protein [Aliishimia ponticola]THH38144.1 DUF3618 domain-containing protein [Aliishimia ponticola]